MDCLTHVMQTRVGMRHPGKVKLSSYVGLNSMNSGSRMMSITMRDRGKNRKPLQKGRNLSIEAIQTVQALKRAANNSVVLLEQVYDYKFRRLLKFDMVAVLRELLRQNQCQLALKVFRDIKKEHWYRPQLSLYTEMVTVLGSNGLIEDIKLLIVELKAESLLNPDLVGFNALLESLMNLNLNELAIECFYLMKSLPCDPDRSTFKLLMNSLESNAEMDLLAVIQQEAKKSYGNYLDFFEEEETEMSSKSMYGKK